MLQQAHNLLDSAEAIAKENTELKETLDRSRQLTREAIGREDKLKNELAELKAGLNKQSELPQDTQLKINTLLGVISTKNKVVENFKEQVSRLKDESNNLRKELADAQAELATTKRELKKTKDTLKAEPNFGWCWNKVGDGTPLDQEQVLVRTKDGVVYLKTYTPECGFRAEEAMWMSIPEYNDTPKVPKQGDKLPQVGSTPQDDYIFTRCVETFAEEVISYNDEQKMEECLIHLRTITNGLREMAVAAGRDLKNITDNRLLQECYNLVDAELHYATEWADKHYALRPQQHPYLFWSIKKDVPLEERKQQHLAQLFVKDQVHHIDNIEELV